jgi:hypothetical protein
MTDSEVKPVLRISPRRDPVEIEIALADLIRRMERAKSLISTSKDAADAALLALLDTAAARMALGMPAIETAEVECVGVPRQPREAAAG